MRYYNASCGRRSDSSGACSQAARRPRVEDNLAAGTLEHPLPTALTPSAPLYAIYPNRTHLPAKVRTFLDFLVEEGW